MNSIPLECMKCILLELCSDVDKFCSFQFVSTSWYKCLQMSSFSSLTLNFLNLKLTDEILLNLILKKQFGKQKVREEMEYVGFLFLLFYI